MASVVPSQSYRLPFSRQITGGFGVIRKEIASLEREHLLILALMLVGLVAHGLNMFNYPSFTIKDDEGIYTEQAWAVLRMHRVTFYTYTYDHAPGGWIQYAFWMFLTGGVDTFGNAVDSGRMLMLLLHIAMIPLLYQLARKLGCSVPAAGFVVFLFSLSPLAIFYQRMVLLDNFMIFWILVSLNLLLDGRGRLSFLALSGICYGFAMLSKETAVFLLPAVLFIVWQQRWEHQGRFAIISWILPTGMVVSWYALFAILKGELLPAQQALNFSIGNGTATNTTTGVSLVDALKWQVSRTDEGGSDFWSLVNSDWLLRDSFLVIGGIIAIGLNLLRVFRRDRRAFAIGLLGFMPMYYLARGGVVFSYYIVFAVPFLALNIAALLSPLLGRMPKLAANSFWLLVSAGLLTFYWLSGTLPPLFQEQPASAGRDAVAWIKQNVPAQSVIIIRDDMWTDLHEAGLGGPAFPYAESHWKVANDPAIYHQLLKNDWHNVDYLVINPGLEGAYSVTKDKLALNALGHAHLIKTWTAPAGNKALHDQQIIQLWKVDKSDSTQLNLANSLLSGSASYLTNHLEQAGAYPEVDGSVKAESEAYAMLRAVWSGDRTEFYCVWNWTKTNLLNSDELLSWQWESSQTAKDSRSEADADSDTALALLMASKRWGDPTTLQAGKNLVQAIWENEVVNVAGQAYITAGNWSNSGSTLVLNPSYFSPYAYHIFQEVDPQHNWLQVVTTGYNLLTKSAQAKLGSSQSDYLFPDWVGLDRNNNQLVPINLPGINTTQYSADAPRTYWRIAIDWAWNKDGRAKSILQHAQFLQSEVTTKNYTSAAYNHDGSLAQEPPSMVGTAGALAALRTFDPITTNLLFGGQLVGGSKQTQGGIYWGNPTDLYTQEWGWFALALYTNSLTNLWHNSK